MMGVDRAELAGTGAAVAFHVALIAALSLSLAHIESKPEPPAMEVEFIEDVGLQAAAPQSVPTPAPASQAPEIAEARPIEPTPAPPIAPAPPAPRIVPTPAPRATERAAVKPAKPAPARPAPRASRIGDDFLKGIEDSSSSSSAPARPAAATFNATAKASIGQAILRQVKPCADRQPFIGEGANRVRLTVNLKMNRSGRLSRPPVILGMAGDPDLRSKYGDLLEDQVRRIFAECTPLRLPADLYDTPTGGWGDFTFTYRVD